ncbi:MAG: S-layer y protein [Clostridia bacterium]|jgi:hypothetical protein|nr:S-layer y protein [Clostridia bacterium]
MKIKKMGRVIVLLGVIVLHTVSTLAATFKDVPTTHWAYKVVDDMQQRGIMLSSSSGEFFPNNKMNYFEITDVLAKATGYVDVNASSNIDETFKQQIVNNYEAQKATLASYALKFTTWDKRYDQQVAYLLGRGYLKKEELDKFIIKTAAGQEAKKIINKQEMAVFVVRLLGKEETAKTGYKSSGFADENLIVEANKPYVAYLKALALINGDDKGLFNPNAEITKAFCAKMISDALTYKENLAKGSVGTETGQATQAGDLVTVKRIIPKGQTEYYILLEKGGNTSFYTIKNTTKVKDKAGNEVAITSIPLETKAAAVITLQNSTEYITSMILQTSSAGTGSNTGNGTDGTNTSSTVVSGTIERIGTNDTLTILLSDDTSKTYLIDDNCVITLSGTTAKLEDLRADDTVRATIHSNTITKLIVEKGNTKPGNTDNLASGEVTAKGVKTEGYVLTIKSGTKVSEIVMDDKTDIEKNNKSAELEDIRIGDKVEVIKRDGVVKELIVTGTKSNITGEVKSIHIAAVPEVTLKTKNGTETFVINQETDIYDNNERSDAVLRDLRLGQTVEVLIDSKEVVSLTIQRATTTITYKGVIKDIGRGTDYIDVLVDYDALSESSKVMKRVKTPLEVEIELNGKKEHRSVLDKDMEIVISYQYLEDAVPEKILIIK